MTTDAANTLDTTAGGATRPRVVRAGTPTVVCPAGHDGGNDAAVRVVNEWLSWLSLTRGRAPITVYGYAAAVQRFLDDVACGRALDAIPVHEIEAWIGRPRVNGRVGKPATRARDTAVLQSLYGWAFRFGHSQRDTGAMLHAPVVHNHRPKAIPDATWTHLWGSGVLTDRDRLMLGLGFFVGLRRAEIAGLRVGHFDSDLAELVGFRRKGGVQGRVPVGELVEVWGDLAPQYGSDRFFPLLREAATGAGRAVRVCPMSVDYINQRLRRIQLRAGLDTRDLFTPHGLRHSFATNLLRLGMPIELVSELMGHTSLDVTMRYVRGGGSRVAEWREGQSARLRLADWRVPVSGRVVDYDGDDGEQA